jgi:hypothetical protein
MAPNLFIPSMRFAPFDREIADVMIRTVSRWTNAALALFGLTLATLLAGCGTPPVEVRPPPPSIRIAVLDFAVPSEWRNPQAPDKIAKEREGWWFGSRDVWQNPGLGRVAGDVFSHQLSQLPFVTVVSRVDIKYYMADKRSALKQLRDRQRRELEESGSPEDLRKAQAIAAMTEADYDAELEKLPPWEIGRELGADRVLTGRIRNAYLTFNRAFGFYWTVVDLELDLYDVQTGNVVWHGRRQFKMMFASTLLVLEKAAGEMIQAMKDEYFYQPAQ